MVQGLRRTPHPAQHESLLHQLHRKPHHPRNWQRPSGQADHHSDPTVLQHPPENRASPAQKLSAAERCQSQSKSGAGRSHAAAQLLGTGGGGTADPHQPRPGLQAAAVGKERNEDPFVIVLDGIEDPHNLGSIIRTAETAGVHGVIIPKRRAVSVNSTVNKASAGAVEHMKIARVTNISDAIEELKKAGLWVCGTAVDTNKYYYNQDLTGPLAIVIGNEGKGIGEKVKKNCDFLVKIPMKGKVQSLNASVSTGIVVYEAVKQRIRKEN